MTSSFSTTTFQILSYSVPLCNTCSFKWASSSPTLEMALRGKYHRGVIKTGKSLPKCMSWASSGGTHQKSLHTCS